MAGLLNACAAVLCGAALAACVGGPRQAFDANTASASPDYSQPAAWLAYPGRNGLERSAPIGWAALDEDSATADVFFIHPTTTSVRDVWNVGIDAETPLSDAALISQVGAFNGCCRLFAPRYRQATLAGLNELQAVELAYGDVARAFHRFLALNDGRPFVVAAHSQGVTHALRLLQDELLGTPLQDRLVVAYLIGGYVPANLDELGLPSCDAPLQTNCVVSWNASKIRSTTARIIINDKTYWWRGGWKSEGQAAALCVNPLTWRSGDSEAAAPASANPGSMPFPQEREDDTAVTLPPLDLHLTGARCHRGMLEVDLMEHAGAGYSDRLTQLAGSYHLQDYGLFYGALRMNAIDRVSIWRSDRAR